MAELLELWSVEEACQYADELLLLPTKPTVPQVAPLVRFLYNSRCGAGCCLHIVLDDGNINDSQVASCVEGAKERQHPDCTALAQLLLRMSRRQRLHCSPYYRCPQKKEKI